MMIKGGRRPRRRPPVPKNTRYGIIDWCITVQQLEVPEPLSVEAIGFEKLIPDKSKVKVLFRQ